MPLTALTTTSFCFRGGATAGPNDESFEFLANALVVSVHEEAKVGG